MNPLLIVILFVVYTVAVAAAIHGFTVLRYRWFNRFYYRARRALDRLDAAVEPARRFR